MKVLLIEDDPDQARLIKRLLTSAKNGWFDTESVATLADARSRIAVGGIDALLVDLGLPDSVGLATFDAVRSIAPAIPIIILTGNGDDETAFEAVRRGAQDYFVKKEVSGPMIARSLRYAVERKRLEQQILTSKKMEAVGLLAGGIAHEFNNLLQTIEGFTRFAMEGLDSSGDRYHYLHHVSDAARRAVVLVRQLLDFGHGQAFEKEELVVSKLLDEVAQSVRPMMEEQIEVRIEVEGDALISGDVDLLKQMLVNLSANSRDAMPNGGQLHITARIVLPGDHLADASGVEGYGPLVLFTIADTGCGIPAGILSNVTEPFFTTRPVGEGTGLGLALAYSIAQQHGGTIRIDSEEGRGTRVQVYLPIVGSSTETEFASREGAPEPQRSGRDVNLVLR